MAENEEDTFDIDIYGDGGQDYQQDATDEAMKVEESSEHANPTDATPNSTPAFPPNEQNMSPTVKKENGHGGNDVAQKISSTDESAPDPVHLPKQAPQAQGLKRKDGADDRPVDPGATTALFVSELHWWVNDDDIRGWANQAQCEDELEEITFSEHKVNGKSKGQAYVLFTSPQAATAAKQKIESFGEGQQYTKRFTVSYTNPYTNPFKTLPKDGPMRNSGPASNNRSTSGAYGGATGGANGMPSQGMGYNNSGSYRGNRGGYNNRGGGTNNMGGYNRGGFQQPMAGGFQSGFQPSPMGGMQAYGGFQNRGGMAGGMRGGPMGMRGGRGGMGSGIMGMPMTGMGMGPMGGMGMNMPQMGVGMGMQGMPGSHSYPDVKPQGSSGLYATPAGQFRSPTFQPQHQPDSPSAGLLPPMQRGRSAPRRSGSSNAGSAWAQYTHYSITPPTTPSTHSFTQMTTSTPGSFNAPPPQSSQMLNYRSSSLGNQAHFNPAFFPQQQQAQQGVGSPDASWNPHGAKRTRQE